MRVRIVSSGSFSKMASSAVAEGERRDPNQNTQTVTSPPLPQHWVAAAASTDHANNTDHANAANNVLHPCGGLLQYNQRVEAYFSKAQCVWSHHMITHGCGGDDSWYPCHDDGLYCLPCRCCAQFPGDPVSNLRRQRFCHQHLIVRQPQPSINLSPQVFDDRNMPKHTFKIDTQIAEMLYTSGRLGVCGCHPFCDVSCTCVGCPFHTELVNNYVRQMSEAEDQPS